MSDNGRIDWANLPRDLLGIIFSKLTIKEMWKGPIEVCKHWNGTGNRIFFSVFDFSKQVLPPNMDSLAKVLYAPSIDRLSLDALLIAFADRSYGELNSIKITDFCTVTRFCTDVSLSHVADTCPDLQLLWLTNCSFVTDAALLDIASKCRRLKELRIYYSHRITSDTLKIVKEILPSVYILHRYSIRGEPKRDEY